MDVVWDQDVRNILCGLIGREHADITDEKVTAHIQLAIKYADRLEEARRKKKPEVQQRRQFR